MATTRKLYDAQIFMLRQGNYYDQKTLGPRDFSSPVAALNEFANEANFLFSGDEFHGRIYQEGRVVARFSFPASEPDEETASENNQGNLEPAQ